MDLSNAQEWFVLVSTVVLIILGLVVYDQRNR
jgi:hypothetical protein